MRNRLLTLAGFAGLALTLSPAAHATLLALGPNSSTVAAGSGISSLPSGTIIASTVPAVQTALSSNGGVWSASLQTVVYQETSSGNLDFLYQYKTLTSSNGSVPDTLAVSNFFPTGTVNVGYLTTDLSGMSGGSVAPFVISHNGGTVDFVFLPGIDPVSVGSTTFTLVVQTPGAKVTSGFITLQDGGAATFAGFEPSSTPEPAGIILFGTASAFTAYFFRRRLSPKV
jgi:hypothetical protein